MRPKALLLTVFLAACGWLVSIPFPSHVVHPTQGTEAEIIATAMEEWESQIGPTGPVCAAQLPDLRVAYVEGEDFERACGRCAVAHGEQCDYDRCQWGCAYACYRDADGVVGAFNASKRTPILVVNSRDKDTNIRHRLIVHETMHWLGTCSGEGQDYYHTDTRYWREGVQGAVEERLAL